LRKYRNATTLSEVNHRLFGIRSSMIKRCTNPSCDRYKDYGGRGIKVCAEWMDDFDAFADWAKANGYEVGLTIDRINNDGDYEPDNCRWITKREQNRNKRTNFIVTYHGESKPLVSWCEELGLRYDPIHNRITKGWDVAEAFETPLASEHESFSSICRRHDINPATARDRVLKFGWTMEEALNTPCNGRGKKPRDLTKGHFGTAECKVCGATFTKHNSRQIYCGERCRYISKRVTYRREALGECAV